MTTTYVGFIAANLKLLALVAVSFGLALYAWLNDHPEDAIQFVLHLLVKFPFWLGLAAIVVLAAAYFYYTYHTNAETIKVPAVRDQPAASAPSQPSPPHDSTYCLNMIALAKARHGSHWIEKMPQDAARRCEFEILGQAAKDLIP